MEASELKSGAIAGFVATVPMSVAMEVMKKNLPWYERYPLPPKLIMMRTSQKAGLWKNLKEPWRSILTWVTHFGFGTTAGTLYSIVNGKIHIPSVIKGILFGLLVWTSSYLGWIPKLGILPPANKHPTRRALLMIAAHVVWGATLGLLVERLEKSRG